MGDKWLGEGSTVREGLGPGDPCMAGRGVRYMGTLCRLMLAGALPVTQTPPFLGSPFFTLRPQRRTYRADITSSGALACPFFVPALSPSDCRLCPPRACPPLPSPPCPPSNSLCPHPLGRCSLESTWANRETLARRHPAPSS
jgi:hypothetical protein